MHIQKVSEDTGLPPNHLLPTYIRYRYITGRNYMYNNAKGYTYKKIILKRDKTENIKA